MKFKLYTKSNNETLLKKIDNNGRQFTAEEHAYATKQEFGKDLKSKESLLRRYFYKNADKLSALAFLIKYINEQRFSNIISLGAGTCVLEDLLKCALPEESKIVAVDFDSFYIEKAKLYFSSIISEEFDFFKNDIGKLQDRLSIHFDLAIFLGSAYVMDDAQFIHLFKKLREIGVKQIIDFHAGYIPHNEVFTFIFSRVKTYIMNKLRRIKIVNKIKPVSYRGKFHGYGRTRGELRSLYKKAGVSLIREISVSPYKYVAICKGN